MFLFEFLEQYRDGNARINKLHIEKLEKKCYLCFSGFIRFQNENRIRQAR